MANTKTTNISQLLDRRLRCFYDEHVRDHLAPLKLTSREDTPRTDLFKEETKPNNTVAHLPGGFTEFASVKSIVIHETTGWTSYQSADMFERRYNCLEQSWKWHDPYTYKGTNHPGYWEDTSRGIGPQFYVDANGTVFCLIGEPSLSGKPIKTGHAGYMNPVSLGIENGDTGDDRGIAVGNGVGANNWWRLSGETTNDLAGMKLYLLLHPSNKPDLMLLWHAYFPQRWNVTRGQDGKPVLDKHGNETGSWGPNDQRDDPTGFGVPYAGSGDIDDGANPATDRKLTDHPKWNNMLFTERDYRSLALLGRCLAEYVGMPRNFLLLPYLTGDKYGGRKDLFRKTILADQRCDLIAKKLGTTTADIQANKFGSDSSVWNSYLGIGNDTCYKGFLSHAINGGHDCPGPLFDWHRFSREAWDWWWYPFDFGLSAPTLSVTRRPYKQARLNTPLIEYYWDAIGSPANYQALLAPASTTAERFHVPDTTPIYALANGVIVAARLAPNTAKGVGSGFILIRHEVFHDNGLFHPNGGDDRKIGNNAPDNRIHYGIAPTYVWSVISFLTNPNFRTDQISDANPDWLNRFIMRLTECELAVKFHTTVTGPDAADSLKDMLGLKESLKDGTLAALKKAITLPNAGWNYTPAGRESSTGQEIELDAVRYRNLANDLKGGLAAKFPLEKEHSLTAVRVILGDFLGFPDVTDSAQTGVEVEIFSKEKLAVPNATLKACAAGSEDYWDAVTSSARNEDTAEANLPPISIPANASAMAWHYTLTDFLKWTNDITWASEWQKYDYPLKNDGVHIDPAPARPVTRLIT